MDYTYTVKLEDGSSIELDVSLPKTVDPTSITAANIAACFGGDPDNTVSVVYEDTEINLRESESQSEELADLFMQQMTTNLHDIYEMQRDLNEVSVGHKVDHTMSEEDRVDWMLRYNLAQQQEQSELVDSISWKWWKNENPSFIRDLRRLRELLGQQSQINIRYFGDREQLRGRT